MSCQSIILFHDINFMIFISYCFYYNFVVVISDFKNRFIVIQYCITQYLKCNVADPTGGAITLTLMQ